MKIRDVITDPKDGSLSHRKIWSNIGLIVCTYAFFKAAITPELLLAYGALTSGGSILSFYLQGRLGARAAPAVPETEVVDLAHGDDS